MFKEVIPVASAGSAPMSDLEFVIGVRRILSSPEKWTQGRLAKGVGGEAQPFNGLHATCWCLIGAGSLLVGYSGRAPTEAPGDILARVLDIPRNMGEKEGEPTRTNVSQFNDAEDTTFDMVSKLLDDAIAKLTPPEEEAVVASDH